MMIWRFFEVEGQSMVDEAPAVPLVVGGGFALHEWYCRQHGWINVRRAFRAGRGGLVANFRHGTATVARQAGRSSRRRWCPAGGAVGPHWGGGGGGGGSVPLYVPRRARPVYGGTYQPRVPADRTPVPALSPDNDAAVPSSRGCSVLRWPPRSVQRGAGPCGG